MIPEGDYFGQGTGKEKETLCIQTGFNEGPGTGADDRALLRKSCSSALRADSDNMRARASMSEGCQVMR